MALMLLESERNAVLAFLAGWRNWVLQGAPERNLIYTRSRGLCVSARYAVMHGEAPRGLPTWLGTMLIEDFGDENYPFNSEIYDQASRDERDKSFQQELSRKTVHMNLARRAWVDFKLMGTQFPVYRVPVRSEGYVARHQDPFRHLSIVPSDYLTDPEEQDDDE